MLFTVQLMHSSLKKAEKLISINNRFTVTTARDMHLKFLIKIINIIPGDQVCKYITI